MRNIFGKGAVSDKEITSAIMSMIKILTEGNEGTLKELLHLCEPYFGDSNLSVVTSEERNVLATTREDDSCSQAVAYKVKDTKKRFYYFREERNGMLFLENVNCIRIYPLSSMGGESSFMMVEQNESVDVGNERIIDIISIATRIHLQEVNKAKFLEKDILTGVGNRDALKNILTGLSLEDSKDSYIGIYSLGNMSEIGVREGYTSVDGILCKAVDIICKHFDSSAYRVSDYKFCVWLKGSLYDVVSKLQDCLDELLSVLPKVKICSIVTPCITGYYKAMYLCEKASDDCGGDGDMVVLIRETDSVFEVGEEEKLLFLAAGMKRKEEAVYETVDYSAPMDATDADVEDYCENIDEFNGE